MPSRVTTAATITVSETLQLLDTDFAELANELASGTYALWLGSGISRECVPDLGKILVRVLNFLQAKVDPANPHCSAKRALEKIIALSQPSPVERAGIDFTKPAENWASLPAILPRLQSNYARVLDVSVDGEPPDFLLWTAVDVCGTYATDTVPPDCEHLCVAILGLEGVLPEVATANWDGLIEAAHSELSKTPDQLLRICIRGEDLRGPPLRTVLYKFHGCAVSAKRDPGTYRTLLVARQSQITAWAGDAGNRPIVEKLVSLVATKPTLMVGMSAQDQNIQNIFSTAKDRMPWPWPSHPPAYVFAEESLGVDQETILKFVYPIAYEGGHGGEVEAGARIPAYGKPLLMALTLHVLAAKLCKVAFAGAARKFPVPDQRRIQRGILELRNVLASGVNGGYAAFVRKVISQSSKLMSLFRGGIAVDPRRYRPLTSSPLHLIDQDPGLEVSGLPELGVALGVLGDAVAAKQLVLQVTNDVTPGIDVLVASSGGRESRLLFVAGANVRIQLEAEGHLSEDDESVVVVNSGRKIRPMQRSPRAAPGRTGKTALREISVAELIEETVTFPELLQRFREEGAI